MPEGTRRRSQQSERPRVLNPGRFTSTTLPASRRGADTASVNRSVPPQPKHPRRAVLVKGISSIYFWRTSLSKNIQTRFKKETAHHCNKTTTRILRPSSTLQHPQ